MNGRPLTEAGISGLILLALLTHSGNWSSAESKHSSPVHSGFSMTHAVCVSLFLHSGNGSGDPWKSSFCCFLT